MDVILLETDGDFAGNTQLKGQVNRTTASQSDGRWFVGKVKEEVRACGRGSPAFPASFRTPPGGGLLDKASHLGRGRVARRRNHLFLSSKGKGYHRGSSHPLQDGM